MKRLKVLINMLTGANQAAICAQAWKPGSQHAGEKRGVAGLLLGRTERAATVSSLINTYQLLD